MRDYHEFLASKRLSARPCGFEPTDPINPKLFDWQAEITRWALRLGRAALFEECGLGKTAQQLEWAKHVCHHTRGDVLILAPLSVGRQTQREGERFDVPVTVCRSQADVRSGVNITNYEMLKHFNSKHFVGVVCDEPLVFKSFMSKMRQQILEAFRGTPFKLECTATPSPNDFMELGNHAEFLEVEGANEYLARWFIADSMHAGNYRLKKHAEQDFWRWVASWAMSLSKPSDLGYSDEGFILPELRILEHVVEVDRTANTDGMLIRLPDMNATTLHTEMRLTRNTRASKVAEIVAGDPGVWVVWCDTDYDVRALKKVLPKEAVNLSGADSLKSKEEKLDGFITGKIRILITKRKMCGFGLNWQHCGNHVFDGRTYSFEQEYQAICRSLRFGRRDPLNVHFVAAETETPIAEVIAKKHKRHQKMKKAMVKAVSESGLNTGVSRKLTPTERNVTSGPGWTLHLGDNCETIRELATDSIGLTVTSPPFEGLYIYSDKAADMGNSADSGEFFEHFRFLVPELLRVTIPGRLAVIHCKDLPLYRGRDGACGLSDFPGRIVAAFEACDWTFHSRVTIWKCPVTERERTNNNGLLHKTVERDSSQLRQGMADFLLVFRKPTATGANLSAEPIERPNGLEDYIGDPELDPRVTDYHPSQYARKTHANRPSIDIWRRYAEPVWWDIDQKRVLNIQLAREGDDERHICPLQLDVVARCIQLWSNPGDLVLDPFSGVGSTGHEALKQRRRYVGIELKPSYWKQSVGFLKSAEELSSQRSLFAEIEV